MPFLAMGAAALVVGLVSPEFQALYPLRVAAALVPLWIWRRCYGPIRVSFSWTALLLGAIAFVIWVAFQGPTAAARGEELRLGVASLGVARVPWIVCRVFGKAFVAPVVEELAFRGFLLRRLIGPDFTEVSLRPFNVKAVLLSSLAFGVLHQSLWAGTLAGMVYALAQHRRGQTGDAILAHAVTNAILTGGPLLGGRWSFWT
jgi:CAAX prenyl protease-like protein